MDDRVRFEVEPADAYSGDDFVECGYCDRRFVLTGGAADQAA